MRQAVLPLLLGASLALGGCAASIAAGLVGAAVRAASPEPGPYRDLRAAATEACRARASQHGGAQIIDAEQRDDGKVTVWGTVQDGQERRSFECGYNGRVTGFRLRAIRAR